MKPENARLVGLCALVLALLAVLGVGIIQKGPFSRPGRLERVKETAAERVCLLSLSAQGKETRLQRCGDFCPSHAEKPEHEAADQKEEEKMSPAGICGDEGREGWYLVRGKGGSGAKPADDARVESVLRAIRGLSVIRSSSETSAAGARGVIRFTTQGGGKVRIELGRQHAELNAIEVQSGRGSRVYLVADTLSFYVTRPPEFWRNGTSNARDAHPSGRQ